MRKVFICVVAYLVALTQVVAQSPTGISGGGSTISALSVGANGYATFANGATTVTVPHSFGSASFDPTLVQCYTGFGSTWTPMFSGWTITAVSALTVTITFSPAAPAAGKCSANVAGGVGPQGSIGATGATGAAGPTGATGAAGTNGAIAQIQNAGSNLTIRPTLNFTGAGVTCADNAGSTRTDCTIPGGGVGGAGTWGSITGTLSSQTDLNAALTGKADLTLSNLSNQATARNNLGLGSSAVLSSTAFADLTLSNLTSQSFARTNLGLGTAATQASTAFAAAVHVHSGADITTGTVAGARIGTHSHSGADITSGTVPAARLGSGTADSTTVLYGDNVFRTAPTGGGGAAPSGIAAVKSGANVAITSPANTRIRGFDLSSLAITISGFPGSGTRTDYIYTFDGALQYGYPSGAAPTSLGGVTGVSGVSAMPRGPRYTPVAIVNLNSGLSSVVDARDAAVGTPDAITFDLSAFTVTATPEGQSVGLVGGGGGGTTVSAAGTNLITIGGTTYVLPYMATRTAFPTTGVAALDGTSPTVVNANGVTTIKGYGAFGTSSVSNAQTVEVGFNCLSLATNEHCGLIVGESGTSARYTFMVINASTSPNAQAILTAHTNFADGTTIDLNPLGSAVMLITPQPFYLRYTQDVANTGNALNGAIQMSPDGGRTWANVWTGTKLFTTGITKAGIETTTNTAVAILHWRVL